MKHHRLRLTLCLALLVPTLCLLPTETASARVRLESICTIYGQRSIKLTGIGLVVGLNGTGDGGKNRPAMQALAQALSSLNSPTSVADLERHGKNTAMVLIEAEIPRGGLRSGQKIDCYVSSPFGAKDLTGGRLLVTPIQRVGPDPGQRGGALTRGKIAIGLASGALVVEGNETLTSAKIPGGIDLLRDIVNEFVDNSRGAPMVTLLLDDSHASFRTASEVARVVNEEFKMEERGKTVARARDAGVVEVIVPEKDRDSTVDFVAALMEIGIDSPVSKARVIVNSKTQTIVVTGEVEISPVVVTHNGLTITVAPPGLEDRFVAVPRLTEDGARQSSQQLRQLVDALDQLRVPTRDIISILREINASGELHAEFIEH